MALSMYNHVLTADNPGKEMSGEGVPWGFWGAGSPSGPMVTPQLLETLVPYGRWQTALPELRAHFSERSRQCTAGACWAAVLEHDAWLD